MDVAQMEEPDDPFFSPPSDGIPSAVTPSQCAGIPVAEEASFWHPFFFEAVSYDAGSKGESMAGCVERVAAEYVSGWAQNTSAVEEPAKVRVSLDGNVLVEGETTINRAGIAAPSQSFEQYGYRLALPGVEENALARIIVEAYVDRAWIPLKRVKPLANRHSYQDFDGTGASKSKEKLAALRLERLPRKDRKAIPLKGKTVLDLGCNEGFFCAEAVRQGATRVVGIDANAELIGSARARCSEATFIRSSWWDIPKERFDVIFFLSAIHYEKEQKRFLNKLLDHLNPGGVLVLECGVFNVHGAREWRAVKRPNDAVRRYPTRELLINDLLSGYATLLVGKSIMQKGDPVPRLVYHCTPRRSTALLVSGKGGSGKTNLARSFARKDVPTYGTDSTLTRLLGDEYLSWHPLAVRLKETFPKTRRIHLGEVSLFIVEQKLEDDLCDLFISEIPGECELFCVEGEVLRHPTVLAALQKRLRKMNIRHWHVDARP